MTCIAIVFGEGMLLGLESDWCIKKRVCTEVYTRNLGNQIAIKNVRGTGSA